jgi:signal transduction histidine kinase
MDGGRFTEPISGSPYRRSSETEPWELTVENRLEACIVDGLKQIGGPLAARSLSLAIWGSNRERRQFHASLSRNGPTWDVVIETFEEASMRTSERLRNHPRFVLNSQFNYHLVLPSRWVGLVKLEFPGITFLPNQVDAQVRSSLTSLSKDISVLLMERELGQVEQSLNEEKELTQSLGAFVSILSKELYCLSSISNALAQSHNVRDVLTRVLESTLPVLRAKLGAIYFPETGHCIVLQRRKPRHVTEADHWLRNYFEGHIRFFRESFQLSSFIIQAVENHPRLPITIKAFLASQHVDSIMEFSLHNNGKVVGLGLLGLEPGRDYSSSARLLNIVLNMVGLFLEHISLLADLEKQLVLTSREKLEMEKEQNFLLDNVGGQFPSKSTRNSKSRNHLLDEIERSRNMALLAELASGVAHQIRNPLNNLTYALHLLRQDNLSETEKKELVDTTAERVETINRMINEFIQYTRIPNPKLELEDLNDILTNSLRSFSGWFELAEIRLETSLDMDLPETRADIFLMNQAFHNIVKNAIEAMHEKGYFQVSTRKLKISHGPAPHLQFAEIVFEDDGPGIGDEDIGQVLQPFYSKKQGGLGLGLPLVDHIVRAHGGALNVKNRVEGGTRVVVYLPIR